MAHRLAMDQLRTPLPPRLAPLQVAHTHTVASAQHAKHSLYKHILFRVSDYMYAPDLVLQMFLASSSSSCVDMTGGAVWLTGWPWTTRSECASCAC
jgi:hypothetical protein